MQNRHPNANKPGEHCTYQHCVPPQRPPPHCQWLVHHNTMLAHIFHTLMHHPNPIPQRVLGQRALHPTCASLNNSRMLETTTLPQPESPTEEHLPSTPQHSCPTLQYAIPTCTLQVQGMPSPNVMAPIQIRFLNTNRSQHKP
jgi:hypothetical protein